MCRISTFKSKIIVNPFTKIYFGKNCKHSCTQYQQINLNRLINGRFRLLTITVLRLESLKSCNKITGAQKQIRAFESKTIIVTMVEQ